MPPPPAPADERGGIFSSDAFVSLLAAQAVCCELPNTANREFSDPKQEVNLRSQGASVPAEPNGAKVGRARVSRKSMAGTADCKESPYRPCESIWLRSTADRRFPSQNQIAPPLPLKRRNSGAPRRRTRLVGCVDDSSRRVGIHKQGISYLGTINSEFPRNPRSFVDVYQRFAVRLNRAKPILDDLETWLTTQPQLPH